MINKTELENLKNVKEAAKDLKNVEEAFKRSAASSNEYFKRQAKLVRKQHFFESTILCLEIARAIVSVFLVCGIIAMLKLDSGNVTVKLITASFSLIVLTLLLTELFIRNAQSEAKIENEAEDKTMLVDMYKSALMLAERKCFTISKVYDDVYAIVEELSKEPEILKRIENTKAEKGIDFGYITDDMEKLKSLEDGFFKESCNG